MTKEIPFVVGMMKIRDTISEPDKAEERFCFDANGESSCEYCLNTATWD